MSETGPVHNRSSTEKKKPGGESPSVKTSAAKKTEKSTNKKVDLYVVVADDDVDDHKLITKAVKDCSGNHLVTSVYNGLQLMNLLLRKGFYKIDFDRLPDIIVLDLKMPVMDGYAALRQIREHDQLRHIPVFVLSDSPLDGEGEKVAKFGGDKFYAKPFSYEELKQLMHDICSEAVRLAAERQLRHP